MSSEKTIERMANASFYVEGSVQKLVEEVQVKEEGQGSGYLWAVAGTLLAKYRESDPEIFGKDS